MVRTSLFYAMAIVWVSMACPRIASSQETETWFGWVETPKQHLRTVLKVQRSDDQSAKADSGLMVSPDQSPETVPLSEVQLKAVEPNGWQFQLTNPKDAKRIAAYTGTQTSADRVEGNLVQSGQKLKLDFARIDEFAVESSETLGADAVWKGSLNLVVKKLEFRIRVYSKPPFASKESPRVLFDSLSERFIGIPATVEMDQDRNTTFEIKPIGAKFTAKLNDAGNELVGKFTQNQIPFPLTLNLVEDPDVSKTTNEPEPITTPLVPTPDSRSTLDPRSTPDPGSTLDPGSTPASEVESKSSDTYVEMPFEVVLSNPKQTRKAEASKTPGASISGKIAGTLTLPKIALPDGKGFPAVVMVTGSGPQDRDETIGRHKPFAVLARFLAEEGVASLRYDDRGVGESTGDFLNATSADFAKDALAVWNHARGLAELDSERIGILGHSEGGLVGPMVANWESKVAFLILLAPPGVTGGDVLKSQIDRMSELQGSSEDTRKVTMGLQQQLQDIASGYFVDEATMKRDIRKAISDQWDALESAAMASDPTANVKELKQQLTMQIEQQFSQLRMPWYSYFLNYDPGPSWLLLRCPTLAIWGENDVQVLPGLNSKAIQEMIERNPALEATLLILPAINHMMQTSQTGLPDEYDGINETISPVVLDSIRQWLALQGLASPQN